jgi:hypothetical protein
MTFAAAHLSTFYWERLWQQAAEMDSAKKDVAIATCLEALLDRVRGSLQATGVTGAF